eukprot:7364787-Pyramimonas_sp.AAC.1
MVTSTPASANTNALPVANSPRARDDPRTSRARGDSFVARPPADLQRGAVIIISLRFTGLPVLITARVRSTPQRPFAKGCCTTGDNKHATYITYVTVKRVLVSHEIRCGRVGAHA